MTLPTNPYYEISAIAPGLVTNGAPATVAYSVQPGVAIVKSPTSNAYDTTTSPLVVTPAMAGAQIQVTNQQPTALRVTTGAASDAGIVVPPGVTVAVTVIDGVLVLDGGNSSVGNGAFSVRAVVTNTPPAYTRVGGVITANAVGAPGNIFDGVTPVAGDLVLLQEGWAAAAADAGPYIVTQMGTASLKLILTRPSWWANGGYVPQATSIAVKEGTVFKNTQWTSWVTTSTVVIGTSSPELYPDSVTQSKTLNTGTVGIFNVPIRSALLTSVTARRTTSVGVVTATLGYQATVGGANGVVAGQVGTASVTIEATLANAAGTVNAADTSILNVTVRNAN